MITTFGYFLFNLLVESENFLEKLSLGYLVGMGLSTLIFFVLNIIGVKYTTSNLFILLTVLNALIICLNLFLKKIGHIKIIPPNLKSYSFLEWSILILLTFFFLTSLINNLYWPINDWDALTLYDFRGQVFALTGFMDPVFSIHRYYLGYPLLTSLSHTFVYLMGGKNPHFLYSINYIAFIVSFYYLVKRVMTRKIALLMSFLLAISFEIYDHSKLAYTNLPYTIYYCLGVIFLFFWIKNKNSKSLIISGILVGLSTWTRSSEPFWIVPLLVVFLILISQKKIFGILEYFLIFFSIKLPWDFYITNKGEDITNISQYSSLKLTLNLIINRAFEVTNYFYLNVLKKEALLYLIFLLGLFFISKKDKAVFYFALMVLLNLAIIGGGIFLYSFIYPKWTTIGDSVSRMSMIFVPLIIFFISLILSKENLFRNVKKNK